MVPHAPALPEQQRSRHSTNSCGLRKDGPHGPAAFLLVPNLPACVKTKNLLAKYYGSACDSNKRHLELPQIRGNMQGSDGFHTLSKLGNERENQTGIANDTENQYVTSIGVCCKRRLQKPRRAFGFERFSDSGVSCIKQPSYLEEFL